MAKYKVKAGGGWASIRYSLRMAKKAGGAIKLYRALKSANNIETADGKRPFGAF